jgi:hypothetical protein
VAADNDTALGWLARLYSALQERRSGLDALNDYYTGDHPLPFLTPAHAEKMRSQFRQMLEESRSNFMRLLVDVVDERLQVEGFRISADSDIQSDKDSWDIWQANQLDSLSRAAMLDSLVKGVSYASVWQDVDDDGYADIAIEDACETIVAYTPGSNFRRRDAAVKAWVDKAARLERATVYLPDGCYRFQRKLSDLVTMGQATVGSSWSTLTGSDSYDGGSRLTGPQFKNPWVPIEGDDPYVTNPIGIVPIVPLRNRGRTLLEGESELADVWQIQNQINSFTFLLMLGGYFGAHRQRFATGIKLMVDEASGEVKEPFDIAIDKLLVSEDPDTKFGEFGQTDLGQYLKSIDQKVAHLAVVSRTPKHYLLPTGQDPSGDAIKSAESGLVRKIERKQDAFGESWEEVMQLARQFQDPKAKPSVDSEVVWADASTESEGVRTDATIKKYGAGLIPKEQALEDLGYSQTAISRIMAMEATEKLLGQVAQADPTSGKIILEPGDQSVDPGATEVKPQTMKA